MRPMRTAAAGGTKAQGPVDGHQAAQEAVGGHADVRLLLPAPGVKERRERPRGRREHRVHGNLRDARVRRGQRRTGVEAEPAEGQDQRPHERHGEIVAGDHADRSVSAELADARPEHDAARQRRHASRHVHDR